MTLELVTQRIRTRFKAKSEIPFSKNSYYIDTIQMIWLANQLIGFCMIRDLLKGISKLTVIIF